MSQEDILKILKNEKEITAKELAKRLDVSENTVRVNLRRLFKSREVLRREESKYGINRYFWMIM